MAYANGSTEPQPASDAPAPAPAPEPQLVSRGSGYSVIWPKGEGQ